MTTGNIIIGYPNRSDAGAISGGAWLAGLPLANMQNRELAKVARSTDCNAASTRFELDLGADRALRTFALVNHNLSADALWRVTLGTTPGGADVHDSGTLQVWQMSFDDILDWESASWWLGIAGDEYLRSPYAAMFSAGDYYTARYVTVQIQDAANADGYVQIGRFFAGNAIQPQYNAAYGLQDAWEDLSTTDRAESGADWAVEMRRLRSVSFVLEHLGPTEASYYHEMQRMVGTTGEVLYMPYPADPGENQRYGFLGMLSELSPIDYPYYRARSLPLRIKERA